MMQLRRRETGSIAKIFSGSASVFASSTRRQLVAHRSCVHLTQAGGKEHDLTGVQALRMRGAQSRDLPIQS